MRPLLFVYGSLLSRVRHPMGTRLRGEARLLGQATIQGRLYSLGRYPGLVEAAGVTVVTVPGSPLAFKVTTPFDLLVAEAVLRG